MAGPGGGGHCSLGRKRVSVIDIKDILWRTLSEKPSLQLFGTVVMSPSIKGCQPLETPEVVKGKIVLLERGECMFIDKVIPSSQFMILPSLLQIKT